MDMISTSKSRMEGMSSSNLPSKATPAEGRLSHDCLMHPRTQELLHYLDTRRAVLRAARQRAGRSVPPWKENKDETFFPSRSAAAPPGADDLSARCRTGRHLPRPPCREGGRLAGGARPGRLSSSLGR